MIGKLITNKFLLTVLIIGIFITSPYAIFAGSGPIYDATVDTSSIPSSLSKDEAASIQPDTQFPETTDLDSQLEDNNNTYGETWDPWKTRAAIHAVASEGDWLALASGYLYDNQIHLYRWNPEVDQYDLVWEVGGGDFFSDVFSLAFGDTNHNNLVEIIAGGEDGRFYVFEQKHIYDPNTNTENMFELVYTSDRLGRIFDLVVEDVDGDYKEDIIVGTLDTVRFFEYSDHSGYPFNPEHWIEYEESYSISVTDAFANYTGIDHLYAVTALEVADTNSNGLWEVVIGTRAGTVFLLENNGTVVDVNGSPFPFMRDDNYHLIWNSGNSIQRAITDFTGGDLDRDGYKEILMVVQGVGAYVLDNIEGEFGTYRIQRDYAGWESDPAGAYPLDTTIDWMLNSSALESVDGSIAEFNPDNFTYYPHENVYVNYLGTNATTHGEYPEPLNNAASSGMPEVYPYRTAMAQPSDNIYTTFDSTVADAWAVLDWGKHEEAAGNGIGTLWDFEVQLGQTSNLDDITDYTFSLSQDGENWFDINATDVNYIDNPNLVKDSFQVEVDNVLNAQGFSYYRYLKINVTQGTLQIDSIETRYFNKPIYDAQSATIGQLTMKGESTPSTVGFIGTIDGALLAVHWNDVAQDYEVIWDSWVDERYKISKNIFDLETVHRDSTFPAWVDLAAKSWEWDLTNGIIGQEQIFTYDAENFYNYRDERDTEFVVSSMQGNMHLYRQNGPESPPAYDSFLTNILFNVDFYGLLFPSLTVNIPTTVQDWMDTKRLNNQQQGLPTYFGVSVVPMDYDLGDKEATGIAATFDRTESGMWLFLSEWDGQIDPQTRQPGDVDVSAWYLFNFPVESQDSPCYPLEKCSTFLPVFNNITDSIIYDAAVLNPVTLISSEMTGQMAGILGTSQWAPKVAGYDVIGSDNQDFIVTNGKVHLAEVIDFANPRPFDTGDINTMFGDLDIIAKPDYFRTINNDEKGRIWTNAEPVDLDNDGDMDLMLGFARYGETTFDISKVSYGFTYWENQGTNEVPIWVEQKKAVTNNDKDSNFRVDRYTEPVLVYNDYDFGTDGFDATYGYHPVYRTGYPTDLFMFQPLDDQNLWNGTVKRFVADYTPQSSLMLATYPEARRVDINLQYEAGNAINYGYHVFETWDNDDELNGWTATVQAGHDLDGDGDQEVIVGDFNNNAYVFEHLTNNTFKRAFKTQDFNRTILTDDSPYAHEQFDGIGGTFYRTIFDHAEYSIAGVDLNENGLQEFIMATPDMIFVFESKYTPGGNIQQDTFELVAQIDILNHPALAGLAQSEIEISAMAYGPDLDLDGRQELVVAVGPALLIFNVFADDPEMPNLFVVQETYFSQTGALRGQWRMPGNYYFFPDLQINSLVIEDIDQDGWVDIIMAGTDKTKARSIRDGFIHLLQWDGVEFTLGTDPDLFMDTILYNPITALTIDDQDYDNQLELIIGHSNGVDIYEFVGDGQPEQREVITSNPHYQLPTRSYQPGPGIWNGGSYECSLSYRQSYCDDRPNFIVADKMSPMKDVLHHSSGFHILVTIGTYSGQQYLIPSISFDNGLTWTVFQEGSGGLVYPTEQNLGDGNFMNLESPIVAEAPDGDIWIGWASRQSSVDGIDIYRRYMIYDDEAGSWTSPATMGGTRVGDSGITWSHRFYPLYNGLTDQMGYAYNYPSEDTGAAADQLTFTTFQQGGSFLFAGTPQAPFANGTFDGGQFDIRTFDIAPLQYNSSLGSTQDYALVLAGTQYNESLTFEDDIFMSEMTMNTSSLYNFTRPTRLASTGISEYNPSVIQEQKTGNLMVTFQAPTLRPYGGLFAMWSDDGGLNWQGPYDMSHPLGLDPNGLNVGAKLRAYSSASGESYRVGTEIGPIYLDYFAPSHPVVAEGGPNGFTMVYSVDIGLRVPRDPRQSSYCGGIRDQQQSSTLYKAAQRLPECNVVEIDLSRIVTAWNPHSNFTWYHLDDVTALDTGDTDDDGRREIAVASGNQAYLYEFDRNDENIILHEEKWMSKEYERDLTDISVGDINGNGFDDIVVTSDRGIVNAYSLLDMNVTRNNFTREDIVARNTPAPTNPVDPFFALGDDFTRRTGFETGDLTEDGIEDVIVIDDFYVGAGDTAKLRFDENYNEVLWAHDVPEFGKYTGLSLLQDIDGDSRLDLIIVYEHAITRIDPYTGEFYWNDTQLASYDVSNSIRNPTMVAVNTDTDSSTLELIFWSEARTGTTITTFFYQIDAFGVGLFQTQFVDYHKPLMKLADVNSDGLDNIILVARNVANPLISLFYVLEYDLLGTSFSEIWSAGGFIIPITDIFVGEFDLQSPGEEWMYVMDLGALGMLFGIDWTIFPSLYYTLNYNSTLGSADLTSHGTFLGIAPFGGGTLEGDIGDVDGDGYDDLVAQGQGGLYTMSTAPSGNAIYNAPSVYQTSAVPYARNSIILGNYCDTDGQLDLVTPISSSSIGCYDSADFTSPPILQWSTAQVSFDVIIDIIPGEFNGETGTDFMLIGRNGFVFIYDNVPLQLNDVDNLNIEAAGVMLETISTVLVSSFAIMAVFSILSRKKIEEILTKLV